MPNEVCNSIAIPGNSIINFFSSCYRHSLPSGLSSAWRSGKVRFHFNCNLYGLVIFMQRQNITHPFASWGVGSRYLCRIVVVEGVTSFISEPHLSADVFISRMSDNTLTTLMGHVPSRWVARVKKSCRINYSLIHFRRCILLLEDLDAAFTRSVSRDSSSTGAPTTSTSSTSNSTTDDGSTLSLSGLLNSLDGVAAAEGR